MQYPDTSGSGATAGRLAFNAEAWQRRGAPLVNYFSRLDQNLSGITQFQTNWQDIAQYELEPRNIAFMLYQAMQYLGPRAEDELAAQCLNFASENIEPWILAVEDRLQNFQPAELSLMLWTCAAISSLGYDKAFRPLAQKIYRETITLETSWSTHSARQISQACAWFDFLYVYRPIRENKMSSHPERKIAGLFREASAGTDLHYVIPGMQHKVDIAVHSQTGGPELMVEVDRHGSHFVGMAFDTGTRRQEPLLSLNTLFQSQLALKSMLRVVNAAVLLRMPTPTVEALLDRGTLAVDDIRQLISRAERLESGTYKVSMNELQRVPLIRPLLPRAEEQAMAI